LLVFFFLLLLDHAQHQRPGDDIIVSSGFCFCLFNDLRVSGKSLEALNLFNSEACVLDGFFLLWTAVSIAYWFFAFGTSAISSPIRTSASSTASLIACTSGRSCLPAASLVDPAEGSRCDCGYSVPVQVHEYRYITRIPSQGIPAAHSNPRPAVWYLFQQLLESYQFRFQFLQQLRKVHRRQSVLLVPGQLPPNAFQFKDSISIIQNDIFVAHDLASVIVEVCTVSGS
jgi:hypothetical protein